MQYRVTVDNGYGVDIVTFTTREAAENAADKAERDDATTEVTIDEVEG